MSVPRVTESAASLRLVPVVTPVGEIGRYVEDGGNGIWFASPQAARDRVAALLADDDAFRVVAGAAAGTWADRPLYRDQFIAACSALATGLRA